MVQCLRGGFLYSEKRVRDVLFGAIAEVLVQEAPVLLLRLTRMAVERGRSSMEAAGQLTTHKWAVAGQTVVNAMLRAGVFLGVDGSTVPPSSAALGTKIAGLHPNYVDLTEAFLLQYLIRELGDVSERDHKALAHALFRQFDPSVPVDELEERVVILLAALESRVALDSNGRYAASGGAISGSPGVSIR